MLLSIQALYDPCFAVTILFRFLGKLECTLWSYLLLKGDGLCLVAGILLQTKLFMILKILCCYFFYALGTLNGLCGFLYCTKGSDYVMSWGYYVVTKPFMRLDSLLLFFLSSWKLWMYVLCGFLYCTKRSEYAMLRGYYQVPKPFMTPDSLLLFCLRSWNLWMYFVVFSIAERDYATKNWYS